MRASVPVIALLLLGQTACAPKRVKVEPDYQGVRTILEQNIANGCYDCLLEAREGYAKQTDAPDQDLVTRRLFELDVLLAIRERELALDWQATLQRARALTADLQPDLNAERVLAMVPATPLDQFGFPAPAGDSAAAYRASFATRRRSELDWLRQSGFHPLLSDYLHAALDCPVNASRLSQPTVPLIQWRRATCGTIGTRALAGIRERVPQFVETFYFEALAALPSVERTGGRAAQAQLAEAYRRFSQSPGVTYLRAQLMRATEDCTGALGLYDETIALQPRHEMAYIGRIMCLTDLKQHSDAIATASQMIELRLADVHEAWYWRAVNRRNLRDLIGARADIDQAKMLAEASDILTMAGIIEFEQGQMMHSEVDLRAALTLPDGEGNCTASWYLGRVFSTQNRWDEAASTFRASMGCCAVVLARLNTSLNSVRQDPEVEPAWKARRIARFEDLISQNRTQQYAAAFNAANYYMRAGNKTMSRELLEFAAEDNTLADQVALLRAALGGGSN